MGKLTEVNSLNEKQYLNFLRLSKKILHKVKEENWLDHQYISFFKKDFEFTADDFMDFAEIILEIAKHRNKLKSAISEFGTKKEFISLEFDGEIFSVSAIHNLGTTVAFISCSLGDKPDLKFEEIDFHKAYVILNGKQ